MENRAAYDVLKNLTYKRKIFIKQYQNLTLLGSKPGIMYGLAEVHKIVTDGLPIFRPMLCLPSVQQYANVFSSNANN